MSHTTPCLGQVWIQDRVGERRPAERYADDNEKEKKKKCGLVRVLGCNSATRNMRGGGLVASR